MTDTLYLEDLIKLKGLKKGYLAERLSISRQALYLKINNESEFTATEINVLCEELGITKLTEKEKIFFVQKV